MFIEYITDLELERDLDFIYTSFLQIQEIPWITPVAGGHLTETWKLPSIGHLPCLVQPIHC